VQLLLFFLSFALDLFHCFPDHRHFIANLVDSFPFFFLLGLLLQGEDQSEHIQEEGGLFFLLFVEPVLELGEERFELTIIFCVIKNEYLVGLLQAHCLHVFRNFLDHRVENRNSIWQIRLRVVLDVL